MKFLSHDLRISEVQVLTVRFGRKKNFLFWMNVAKMALLSGFGQKNGLGTVGVNLLVQTLKKYKNTHSKDKMEIRSNLGWKYDILLIGDGAPVSNRYFYHKLRSLRAIQALKPPTSSNVHYLYMMIFHLYRNVKIVYI